MIAKQYLGEELCVQMTQSEFDSSIAEARKAGFREAFRYKEKYDRLEKAVRSIGTVLEALTEE